MTIYLLDSNVFIQAKNLHYGLDFCPAFWQWLDEAHSTGTVYSIDSVRTELIAGNDDLSAWVQQRPSTFFITPSAATVPSLQATSIWANNSGYEPAAVSTFLQVADYYLVAQALELHYTVVTHEVVATRLPCLRRHERQFRLLRTFGGDDTAGGCGTITGQPPEMSPFPGPVRPWPGSSPAPGSP